MRFLAFALLIILSLFIFFPSFQLSLFGDDWLAFYRYSKLLGSFAQGQENHLTYFLTPYGSQDILMGLLQKVYGYESTPYYLTSYLFRIIAVFSFYPIVIYLTKSKIAALFAILFFSITTTGLDTTNWVFNMPSYITIALFNLFLYFFLKSRQGKFRLLLTAGLLYYLAYVITPIRMHGSLLFILLLEAFWIFQTKSLKIFKKVAMRVSLIIFVFLIIKYTGHSITPNEITERLNIGITTDLTLLSQGRFDFIFYPLLIFGSMFIPDFILPTLQIASSSKLVWQLALPVFLGFLMISLYLMKILSISKDKFLRYLMPASILWTILVTVIHRANLQTFSNYQYIFSLLVGGYILILLINLGWHFFKETYISTTIFLGATWSILSFFFAWWWVPTSIFPTTYRYLIVSAVGVSILLATIVGLGRNRKQQIVLFSFFLILVVIHIASTYSYLSQLKNIRSQELYSRIWSKIPHIPEIGKSSRPIIFYFEGDGTNGGILHDVITFGFPFHMALNYNFIVESKMPLTMDSWEEVVSAVSDGQSFKKHYGIAIDPIPIENVYVFKLEGRDNLINLTDDARKQLKRITDS